MEKISHTCLEQSKLYLDLSESLLNKIDIYLSNVDLTNKQKKELTKLLEEAYEEGYVESLTD